MHWFKQFTGAGWFKHACMQVATAWRACPHLARTPASASACRITSQACGLVGLYMGPPALSLSLPAAAFCCSACITSLLLEGCLLLLPPLCRWWAHAACLCRKDEVPGERCRKHEGLVAAVGAWAGCSMYMCTTTGDPRVMVLVLVWQLVDAVGNKGAHTCGCVDPSPGWLQKLVAASSCPGLCAPAARVEFKELIEEAGEGQNDPARAKMIQQTDSRCRSRSSSRIAVGLSGAV